MKITLALATLLVSSLICNVYADCVAQVTVSLRVGASYQAGGTTYDIYDFTVTNIGSEPLTAISEDILFLVGSSHPSAVPIAQSWNFDPSTGDITGFGSTLLPGQSFTGAGFAIDNIASINPIEPTPTCASTSTSAPTPTPTPTAAPTSAASAGCNASLTLSAQSSYSANGYTYVVYDMTVTNTGVRPITQLFEYILFTYGVNNPSQATLVQAWNFNTTTGEITNFYQLLPGQSYSGAGFIIDNVALLNPITLTAICA